MRECFRGLIDFSDYSATEFMTFFCDLLQHNGIAKIKYTQVASKGDDTRIYFEAFAEEEYMHLGDENFAKLIVDWWKDSPKTIDFGQDFLFEVNWIGKCSDQNKLYNRFHRIWINHGDHDRPLGYNTVCAKNINTVSEWNKTWGKYHLSLVQQNNLQK